jgi:two-component SAPR family response regulator
VTHDPRLEGLTVLVVEDDYYLAEDAGAALARAGARVLGPFAQFDEAQAAVANTRPDCAVLDINLGGSGPDFAPAEAMLSQGVPMMFVTGYDRAVIPSELSHVQSLQKPITGRAIVQAVGQMCNR